jgi:hypothetical protein
MTLVTSDFDYKYGRISVFHPSCTYSSNNTVHLRNRPLRNGSKHPTLSWLFVMVMIMEHIMVRDSIVSAIVGIQTEYSD